MSPKATPQLSGLHPRSETLVAMTRAYDRERASRDDVEEQLNRETRELVDLQVKHDYEYVTDGALGWQDQLRPFIKSITGLAETTRYSRWYDTNTFYQKPVVTGEVQVDHFETSSFIRKESMARDRKWKVTLPGPYTLTELSENKHYTTTSEFLQDYAQALRETVTRLRNEGVRLFQLSEPSLVYWPYRENPPGQDELKKAFDAIQTVVKDHPDEFIVQTYFGNAQPILPHLLQLPVKAVGFDMYETDWSTLSQYKTETGVVLGIVDAEESWVEDPEWIAKTARMAAEKLNATNVTLAPNTDLKFVPREIADRKLAALGEASKTLNWRTS